MVSFKQLLIKRIMMDVVVADVKLGGVMKLDLTYAIIQLFSGEEIILY